MKRFFVLALAAFAITSVVSLQAENQTDSPVYDPMTWKADTIRGVAGYTIPMGNAKKSKKGVQHSRFLPMKNLNTGAVMGKLQPVSISDYSLGWSYIQTMPLNSNMADNEQPAEKEDNNKD